MINAESNWPFCDDFFNSKSYIGNLLCVERDVRYWVQSSARSTQNVGGQEPVIIVQISSRQRNAFQKGALGENLNALDFAKNFKSNLQPWVRFARKVQQMRQNVLTNAWLPKSKVSFEGEFFKHVSYCYGATFFHDVCMYFPYATYDETQVVSVNSSSATFLQCMSNDFRPITLSPTTAQPT